MEFKSYKLSQLVKRKKVTAKIEPEKHYKRVTVKLYHKGVIQRDEELGVNIKSSMFYVSSGDFILSGIDARNGAFGIVPEELEGAIITNDFWCLEPNAELLNKEFFLFLTSTSFFDYICKICSDGTTQRIRLQKDKFFDFEISIPSVKNQLILVEKLKLVNSVGSNISSEITHQLDLIKDLRQAFLREAMQGILVSNETQDGATGADLLTEIQAEKAQLVKEKKIKKPKTLAPISEDELPFDIPENWTWCRLGEILDSSSGSTPLRSNFNYWNGNISWLKSGELNDSIIVNESEEKITETALKETSVTMFNKGTLLIALYGATAGKLGILNYDSTTNQAICGFTPANYYDTFFLYYLLKSFRKKIIEDSWGQAQPNISQQYLKNFIIPLPPLEIQERIVAKLDELMAVCDALETQVKQSQHTNEQLLQQVLREALGVGSVHQEIEAVKQPMQINTNNKQVKSTEVSDIHLQIAAIAYMMESNLGLNYGNVALQKTVYNTNYFNPKLFSKSYDFTNHNYGTFSKELAVDISNNPFLTTLKVGKDKEAFKIDEKKKGEVLDFLSAKENKHFVRQIIQLLDIYKLPFIKKETSKIELFNTVLKAHVDTDSYDLELIYDFMKNWSIQQENYTTKADKFSKDDTAQMLELIHSININ